MHARASGPHGMLCQAASARSWPGWWSCRSWPVLWSWAASDPGACLRRSLFEVCLYIFYQAVFQCGLAVELNACVRAANDVLNRCVIQVFPGLTSAVYDSAEASLIHSAAAGAESPKVLIVGVVGDAPQSLSTCSRPMPSLLAGPMRTPGL